MASLIDIRTDAGSLDLTIGADNDFYITKQIFDLHNFEGKNSNFTSKLTVPATPSNSRILSRSNQQGQAVESKIQCSIILDSITVAPIAWLLISRVELEKNADTFDLTIFYGNFNLFDDLKAVTLQDINWADTNTDWEPTESINKANNTYLDNDIVIPVCDWYDRESEIWSQSNGLYTQVMDINLQGFFIYCRTIIERIVGAAGFTLIVEESTPEEFNRIALACPIEKFIEPPEFEGLIPSFGSAFSNLDQIHQDLIDAKMLFQATGLTDNITYANNEFTIVETGNYNINTQGDYSNTLGHPNASPSAIEIRVNGVEIDSIQIPLTEALIAFDVRIVTPLIAGDIVNIFLHSGSNLANQINTLEVFNGSSFAVASVGGTESRIVNTADHLPDMEQSTFLANILKLYNLFIVTDEVNKTVTISPFDSIYTAEETDLTNKKAVNEPTNIELAISSIGRRSNFNWDEDNLLRRDSNSFEVFNNSLLPSETTIIEMDFSACDVSALLDRNFIGTIGELKAKIPLVNTTYERSQSSTPSIDVLADGSFTFVGEPVPNFEVGHFINCQTFVGSSGWYRVLRKDSDTTGLFQAPAIAVSGGIYYEHLIPAVSDFTDRLALMQINGNEDYYFWQQGTEENMLQVLDGSFSAIWPESLKMSSIKDTHYKNIMEALQTPHIVKAYFNLSAADFAQLDQTEPIYLADFGAQYYINKVDQFKVNHLTLLELIRINKLIE